MKKFSIIAVLTAIALISLSCAKEDRYVKRTINLTINTTETKTLISDGAIIWNNDNERIRVFEESNDNLASAVSSNGITTDNGITMSFGTLLDEIDTTPNNFSYYAVYPSASVQSGASSVNNVGITVSNKQKPSSTSFDSAADILIAEKVDNGNTQASNLTMSFARVVALAKMSIYNLDSEEKIMAITFSAKKGQDDVIIAGRTSFNLATAKKVSTYGDRTASTSIQMDYATQNITANGMDAWFFCYPFNLVGADGDSFKVIVETETKTFTKEVAIPNGRNLVFEAGEASRFRVNMSGIEGENRVVNMSYAYLDAEDYINCEGVSNSYALTTITKATGDVWKAYALKSNNPANFIQVRNNASTNDSYIETPLFANNINKVVVTLGAPITPDKRLTLETQNNLKTGSIASLTTVEGQTVYTFNISNSTHKKAYFRTNGAAAYVSKIEVFTDSRTPLSAPASVSAALNGSNSSVIDVTFSTVEGAASYTIVATPTEGDAVTKANVNSSPATISVSDGLSYSTSYTISVYAVPTDTENYRNSEATAANGSVTTGADPNPSEPQTVTYTVTSISAVEVSGTAPSGSSATYSQTYGTVNQMTSGNSITLTLSGYAGKRITGASVSVKSNSKGGGGSLSLTSNGSTIASITDSKFNTAAWNGSWSTSYVDKTLSVTQTTIGSGKTIVLTISATANSLYFESLTLTYE